MKIARDPYNSTTYFRSEVYGNMIQMPIEAQIARGNWVFNRDVGIRDWQFDEMYRDNKRLESLQAHTETVNMR